MMKSGKAILITTMLMAASYAAYPQEFKVLDKPEQTEIWEPIPPKVEAEGFSTAPSDAIILFDGTSLEHFVHKDGSEVEWDLKDGYMQVVKGTGDIYSKEWHEDVQLHIEWRADANQDGEGQLRSNSGVFLQGIYEVQVLDNWDNPTYVNGQVGSIYKQYPPAVNAIRPPGEWNTYDIIFEAPKFDPVNGAVTKKAKITVFHNGVLLHHAVELQGDTPYIGTPSYRAHGAGPLRLQDHNDGTKSSVAYRNIWIRKLVH